MKKLISLVLMATFVIIMVGCGKSTISGSSNNSSYVSKEQLDNTSESSIATSNEQKKDVSEISLSDGPIFLNIDHSNDITNDSFTLTMYSLKDKQQHQLFSFDGNK